MSFVQEVGSHPSVRHAEAEKEAPREQPIGELISQLSRDVTLLARQEVALAKQEAADKVGVVKAEAVGVAVGAVALHAGALALVAALVLGLAQVLPPWLAALTAAGVLLAAGAGLLLRAKSRLAELDLSPKLVVENVQRDVSAVKEAAK